MAWAQGLVWFVACAACAGLSIASAWFMLPAAGAGLVGGVRVARQLRTRVTRRDGLMCSRVVGEKTVAIPVDGVAAIGFDLLAVPEALRSVTGPKSGRAWVVVLRMADETDVPLMPLAFRESAESTVGEERVAQAAAALAARLGMPVEELDDARLSDRCTPRDGDPVVRSGLEGYSVPREVASPYIVLAAAAPVVFHDLGAALKGMQPWLVDSRQARLFSADTQELVVKTLDALQLDDLPNKHRTTAVVVGVRNGDQALTEALTSFGARNGYTRLANANSAGQAVERLLAVHGRR